MDANVDFFRIEGNNILPKQGRILISEPFLGDIYFKRSIVLLTEHSAEGSVGFVLNKPIEMRIQEIMPDFPSDDFPLSLGGPVGTNTIHYIHTLGDKVPNSIKIFDKIYWSGDFDALIGLILNGEASKEDVRFFLGYSGWSEKQLEKEIDQNSWLVSNLDSNSIMNTDMNSIWSNTLNAMGSKYKMWINSPENANLN